jgi:ketosteroid isomerase-like protein
MMESGQAIAIRRLIETYLDRFNAADFTAAMACYRLPFTWFFGAREFTVATPEKFVSTMTKMNAKLVTDGLGESVLRGCTVRMLGDSAALAGVKVSRIRPDGTELELTGGTYLVHDRGDGWRLAAFVGHRLDDIILGEDT